MTSKSMEDFGSALEDLLADMAQIFPADKPPNNHVFIAADYERLADDIEVVVALHGALSKQGVFDPDLVQDRMSALAYALNDELMRRLFRAIAETLPAPGVFTNQPHIQEMPIGATARAAVRLYLLIDRHTVLLTGRRRRAWWRQDLNRRIAHLIGFHQREINKLLAAEDPPDVRALSHDLMRMDILVVLLRCLHLSKAVSTVLSNLGVTARLTVNSASDSIERYIKEPNDLNRFDLAIVISCVDDLITVVKRVRELAESNYPTNSNVHGHLDKGTLERFIKNLGVLILKLFDDLTDDAHSGTIETTNLESLLAKVERTYKFCRAVGAPLGINLEDAATKAIRVRANVLMEALATTDDAKQHLQILQTSLQRCQLPTDE